jgi:voltage-gated potassium channel
MLFKAVQSLLSNTMLKVNIRKRIWEVLETGNSHDKASLYIDIFLISLILLNIVAVLLETVDSIYNQYKTQFLIFERLSTFIFLIEYILRVWVSIEAKKDNDSSLITRLKYMITWPAIIDLLAVLSGLLPMLFEVDLRLLRALRMIRLLKFSRYFKVMNLLLGVLKEEKQSFLAAMFLLVIALLIASTGIYIFEKEAQPDKFGSIPESMWWAIATLTTIGYGDVTPITSMGKLFGAIIAIIGIGTVALPSGILASGFSDQLKRRQSKYENELNKALQDGIITTKERSKLTQIAEDMNLSEDQIKTMEKKLKEIN